MRLSFCRQRVARTAGKFYKLTSSTRLTSLTWVPARSSSTGIRSISSLSCASENQLDIGRACCGWNMYEVGELSIMMVFLRSLPTWERSCKSQHARAVRRPYLDIVSLVVVAALAEEPVVHDAVYVELIQQRISVLPS